MIKDESFLRRLPITLDAAARLRIEALVIAIDSVWDARNQMQEIMLRRGVNAHQMTTAERARLFSAAWSIVDQFNVVRQLLKVIVPPGVAPEVEQFITSLSITRSLRNKIQHLSQNIPQHAKSRRSRHPVFGLLTYDFIPPEGIKTVCGEIEPHWWCSIAIYAGDVGPNRPTSWKQVGVDMTYPISHLRLDAFSDAFDLDKAILTFIDILPKFESWIERTVTQAASALAAAERIELNRLLRSSDDRRVFRIYFGPPEMRPKYLMED